MSTARTLPWDWYEGTIPDNVVIDETAYIETAFSFYCYRSEEPVGVRVGRGSSTYLGTMFDVGPCGRVTLGNYVLCHGVWFICDAAIEVGDHALLSWNVVLMDTRRTSLDPLERRRELEQVPGRRPRVIHSDGAGRPLRIGPNVWIGFDTCVLPGVTIGEGSVVGARSVVAEDVPPYSIVAGNPARLIRRLTPQEQAHDT